MEKLWNGGFDKDIDKLADEFNKSIKIDIALYNEDIAGSIAHSKMLARCGIISNEDCEAICQNLLQIQKEIESGSLVFDTHEDVHMFIESTLTKRIGEAGKRLHTARSRNDQVATDFRLYVKKSTDKNIGLLKSLCEMLMQIAGENLSTIMSGYTHMQKAQPITLAHHLMAYAEMFYRDIERFADSKKRVDIMPLGSCALAGTTYPIDRKFTAKELGFSDITNNSLDAVSDRDFVVEYLFCASTVLMHISRFCEELIIWATNEFAYIKIDDSFSTGSSIMPQKKNPDIAELLRGKTGRVFGNLIAMLTIIKGLPLAYNKDLQEDKEILLDSETTLQNSLIVLVEMLKHITFCKERMYELAKNGYLNATDVADYLTKRGVPFRTSHEITAKIVYYATQNNLRLEEIPLEKYKEFSPVFESTLLENLKLETLVESRNCEGAPASQATSKSIENLKSRLGKFNNFCK